MCVCINQFGLGNLGSDLAVISWFSQRLLGPMEAVRSAFLSPSAGMFLSLSLSTFVYVCVCRCMDV